MSDFLEPKENAQETLRTGMLMRRLNAEERRSIVARFFEFNLSVCVIARSLKCASASVETVIRDETERRYKLGVKNGKLLAA